MASTPDTSFSSAESPRGRSRKTAQFLGLLPSLPSPQPSDADLYDLTDDAYHTIRGHFCGLPAPLHHDITFDLRDQATFEFLYERLDKQPGLLSHFEDEIRKDWDADTGILRLIFMAEPIHEVTKIQIDKAIDAELDRIARENPALQSLRAKLVQAGHSHIKKNTKNAGAPVVWKVPDGQTRFEGYRHPPFLVEVANSQREKDLLDTVKGYFTKFPGEICTVLSINIEAAEEHQRKQPDHFHAASVSLWTSSFSSSAGSDDGKDVLISHKIKAEFRNSQGQALPGMARIPFADFLPLKERDKNKSLPDADIRLDFADLARYVGMGEARQRESDKSISRSPTPQRAQGQAQAQAQERRPAKVQFADLAGDIVDEHNLPSTKRRRTARSTSAPASLPRRTRSQSRPRRSSRIESRGRQET